MIVAEKIATDTIKSKIPFLNTRNIYTIMLILQLVDLLNVLVVHQMNEKGIVKIPEMALGMTQFFIISLLTAIVLIFVRKFVKNNAVYYGYMAAVFASIFFMFLSESPAGASFPANELKLYRLSGLSFQVLSLCFMCVIIFRDIFQKRHDIGYCLTGAASLFLLIGTIFAALYSVIEVAVPGSLTMAPYKNVLIPAIQYSFFIISGQEPVVQAGELIRNISILESIFSNLYAVMVVGRLLTK